MRLLSNEKISLHRSVYSSGPQMWSVDTVFDVSPPRAVRAVRDLAAQKRTARVTTRRLTTPHGSNYSLQ